MGLANSSRWGWCLPLQCPPPPLLKAAASAVVLLTRTLLNLLHSRWAMLVRTNQWTRVGWSRYLVEAGWRRYCTHKQLSSSSVVGSEAPAERQGPEAGTGCEQWLYCSAAAEGSIHSQPWAARWRINTNSRRNIDGEWVSLLNKASRPQVGTAVFK